MLQAQLRAMKHLKSIFSQVLFHATRLERESIAAILAIALEYYNLFVIGYLSPIITANFFDSSSHLNTTMLLLLSFIAAPAGAIICGHVGDKLGRKKILVWTIALIAIPSLLISILPNYDQIGVSASYCFMILRLIQSFAFGGEFIGLVTFILEDVPAQRRGLFGGLMSAGGTVGVVLASFAIAIFNFFGREVGESLWQWRFLLMFGFCGIFISIYFHRTLSETATFKHYQRSNKHIKWPLKYLLKKHGIKFLRVLGAFTLAPIITIVFFGFLPHLGSHHLGLHKSFSMWSNTAGLLLFAICAPCFGALSDKVGRKPVIFGIAIFYLLFSYPLFLLMLKGEFFAFFIINLTFAFVASAYYGVNMTMCIEQFPTSIRYTGVGVGYVLAHTIFGDITGLSIVKELVLHITSIEFAPVYYLFFGCIVVIISTLFMEEESREKLQE